MAAILVAGLSAAAPPATAATLTVCSTGSPTHESVASAVAAASDGDTIEICAGTYTLSGVLTIATPNLTVRGAGDGAGGTILESSGNAIDLKASGVTLAGFRLQPSGTATWGINISGELTDITLDGITVIEYDRQFSATWGYSSAGGTAKVTGLTVRSSSFLGGRTPGTPVSSYGWGVEFSGNNASAGTVGIFDVTVTDTMFADHRRKGLYIESMSDAVFDRITIRDSAVGPFRDSTGFDINLKYGAYRSITIRNSTVVDSGLDNPPVGQSMFFDPPGIGIKARDDGADYGGVPATLTGVLLENVTVSGGVVGVTIGEPGKDNAGPTGVVIRGSSLSGTGGAGLDNRSLSEIDARFNWWGSASGPLLPRGPGTGQIRTLLDVPVRYEPFCASASNCPPASPSDPGPSYRTAPDGSAPTVTPGSATILTSSGEQLVPEVRVASGGGLGAQAVVISTPDLRVEVAGDRGASPSAGAVAAPGGEIVSRIEADIPAGAVVEVWLFSTPRLVAAARADVDGQVDVVVPLSAPLDGGGPVEAGTHTLQLLIPTSSGTIGVNVGVTVGGPAPTSVPSGVGPSVAAGGQGLVELLGLGTILTLLAVHLRRRREAPGPA